MKRKYREYLMPINNTPLQSESELTALLRLGNEKAFSSLYNQYSQRIYANLRKLVKDDHLAEELLQEVFLKIWDKRETLNFETSFKSYLYKISENLVRDFFRKALREKKLMDKLVLAATDLYDTVEDIYVSKEQDLLFQKALSLLPPQRKLIFTLCKIEGNSYDEVSKLLGISNSTVNDHIVKATKSIRKHMIISGDIEVLCLAATLISSI